MRWIFIVKNSKVRGKMWQADGSIRSDWEENRKLKTYRAVKALEV